MSDKQYLDHIGRPFDNQRGDYHTKDPRGGPTLPPVGASPHYPDYICKNSCGYHVSPDSDTDKCPNCNTPLIRYQKYEQKQVP